MFIFLLNEHENHSLIISLKDMSERSNNLDKVPLQEGHNETESAFLTSADVQTLLRMAGVNPNLFDIEDMGAVFHVKPKGILGERRWKKTGAAIVGVWVKPEQGDPNSGYWVCRKDVLKSLLAEGG